MAPRRYPRNFQSDGPRRGLIIARSAATYSGLLDTVPPEAPRLIMVKADGSVLLHGDAGRRMWAAGRE